MSGFSKIFRAVQKCEKYVFEKCACLEENYQQTETSTHCAVSLFIPCFLYSVSISRVGTEIKCSLLISSLFSIFMDHCIWLESVDRRMPRVIVSFSDYRYMHNKDTVYVVIELSTGVQYFSVIWITCKRSPVREILELNQDVIPKSARMSSSIRDSDLVECDYDVILDNRVTVPASDLPSTNLMRKDECRRATCQLYAMDRLQYDAKVGKFSDFPFTNGVTGENKYSLHSPHAVLNSFKRVPGILDQ